MKLHRLYAALPLTLLLAVPAPVSAQATHLAVIVGLAGEPEHAELFNRWAGTLMDASARMGVDDVMYLSEKPEVDAKRITGKSTKEEITKAFDKLTTAGEDDVVFVTTASASGPFMAALAAPGRTIVTATRTGAERFATLFGGYFADALAGTDADSDKNRRISVLEAFVYAKREVATAYEREGIMSTEHALLNDSGGEGVPDPTPDGKQGKVAAVLSLGSVAAGDPLPSDPKLRALYLERRDIERRIEALKLLKGSMPADRYTSELEKMATDLALKTREIRELEKK